MSARMAGWWIGAGVVAIVLLTVEAVAAASAGMWPLAALAGVLAAAWLAVTVDELRDSTEMSDASSRPPGSASADSDRGSTADPRPGSPISPTTTTQETRP